ncbi:uroporphyrinogen-III synthase [Deinococcus arenicola]|uniref:Uroporphyrinogen-III synthase n=1 Tax=Deinococcus arenicola TaxID=2994950 RepID=A0ABU4DPH9_9DEIO|nr:uroporphyrinogen-III synthase [Deinococcus sp. ZS9-10]MDV6374310.1 uroporphyrinogen-III synthase [Deinococcus sp. ZS9-10]
MTRSAFPTSARPTSRVSARTPSRSNPTAHSPAPVRQPTPSQSTTHHFGGLNILSLESRRSEEMAALIASLGGVPVVVPCMKEQKPNLSGVVDTFERALVAGDIHALICMTGLGTRLFLRELTARDPQHLETLRTLLLVACGQKALDALAEAGLSGTNMTRLPDSAQPWDAVQGHLLSTLESGQHAAVLEYGEALPGAARRELLFAGLRVSSLQMYRCAFPTDTSPLDRAVRDCVLGGPNVLLLSSGTQALHFLKYAEGLGLLPHARDALNRLVIVSIGPACSEAAADLGLRVDLEAAPHKMSDLVELAARHAPEILEKRRLLRAG